MLALLAGGGALACGATRRSQADGNGGTSSSSVGGGPGDATHGSGGASATGSGGASATASGGAGITTASGGSASNGGSAGVGEAGGAGASAGAPGDGLTCDGMPCGPGMICINCDFLGDAFELDCVPHPDRDPQGFQAATERCPAVNLWAECDGSEDCAAGEFCSFRPVDTSNPDRGFAAGQCSRQALSCDLGMGCTLCNDSSDCPEGWRCSQAISLWWTDDSKGCVQ